MKELSDFSRLLGKRALIVGEIASGKTRLLSKFLDYLVERGYGFQITLIEMAPGFGGIGRLTEEYTGNVKKVNYLKPEKIYPPRTLGKTREEVLRYTEHNYRALKPLLQAFIDNPTEILLVNDLTIYLHAGEVEDVLRAVERCETFAATAYEGVRLQDDKGSGITFRERKAVSKLRKNMDLVVELATKP